MPEKPRHFDDLSELLSAYLDGELTADEQALVERRLGESAEFRQLHEELRGLRSSLEALPRRRLGPDFSDSVLRRAERAMLATPAIKPVAAQSDEPVALAEAPTARERIARGLRASRWSLVAIAIALLIMAFNRDERQEDARVAMVNEEAAKEAKTRSKDSGDGMMMAAPAELESLKLNASDRALEKAEVGKVHEAPTAASAAEVLAGKPSAAMPADALADAPSPNGQSEAVGGGLGGGVGAAPTRVAGSLRTATPESKPFFGQKEDRQQTALTNLHGRMELSGDVLIVRCDISPQAAKSGAFEQLLAEQQIELVSAEMLEKQFAGKVGDDRALDRDSSQNRADSAAAKRSASEGETAGTGEKSKAENASVDDSASLEAFYVEASPEQISATLAELNSRSGDFLALSFQSHAANGVTDALSPTPGFADAEFGYRSELAVPATEQADKKPLEPKPAAPPSDAFAADERAGADLSNQSSADRRTYEQAGAAYRGRAVRLADGSRSLQAILPEAIAIESAGDATGRSEFLRRKSLRGPSAPADAKASVGAEPAPAISATRPPAKAEGKAAQEAPEPSANSPRRVLFLLRVVPSGESSR